MGKTPIEWVAGNDGSSGESWNPIRAKNIETGRIGWFCTKPSAGCKNCYSEAMNQRTNGVAGIGNGVRYAIDQRDKVEVFLDEKVLEAPLHWKKPRRIFVCSMTDLFGEFVKDEWLDKIYAVMALCPQHTFMVLTKRPGRRLEYFNKLRDEGMSLAGSASTAWHAWACSDHLVSTTKDLRCAPFRWEGECVAGWPLRNVWEGASTENQPTADERIPPLLQTPAAVRWISAEPLLGPIDFGKPSYLRTMKIGHERSHGLDWVVVGGESGPGARQCDKGWIESIIEQCKAAGVACFVKQLGSREASPGDRKGSDVLFWPEHLRVREYPAVQP